MEASGELLHYLRRVAEIVALILLIPIGAYLRGQTYRNVHGRATIGRDLSNLWESLQRWRRNRRERRKQRTNRNNLKNK